VRLNSLRGLLVVKKRRALNKYKARINRGQIIPVYENDEIIGYVPNPKYHG